MLSSLFHEFDPEEYTPLISDLDHYPVDHPLDTSSASGSDDDSDLDDEDDDEAVLKKNEWLFRLINWDQIFQNAAAHLNINFNDYDYDRYTTPSTKDVIPNNVSSVDTFNYFMSSLSNGNLKVTDKPPGSSSTSNSNKSMDVISTMNVKSSNFAVTIYEIIYDRVAKSRLYSLKGILDEIYPEVNVTVNRILAEIIRFELAPDSIRHMLYRSIINEYHEQCRPKWSKMVILGMNWLIYIAFFAVHIMWLQFVWMDFLKHFNWRDDPPKSPDPPTDMVDPGMAGVGGMSGDSPITAAKSTNFKDPPHMDFGDDLGLHGAVPGAVPGAIPSVVPGAASNIFAQSIAIHGATPMNIFSTMGQWSYFQWTTLILFLILIAYMVVLYCIARRVDAFGDFLKKLELSQLLKLGEAKDLNEVDNENVVMLQYAASNTVHHHNANFHIPLGAGLGPTVDQFTQRQGHGQNQRDNSWGLDSDNDSEQNSVFTESSEADVWNYGQSVSAPVDVGDTASLSMLSSLHSLSGRGSRKSTGSRHGSNSKGDVLSKRLIKRINGLYYTREHLILYTVISLVKMLIILLYLSCLVLFFLIPSADYWYFWTLIVDVFALYVAAKAMKEVYRNTDCYCLRSLRMRGSLSLSVDSQNLSEYTPIRSGNGVNIGTPEDALSVVSSDDGSLVDIADTDGIFKHEWIVATANIVSISSLLVITTFIVAQYMSDYTHFVKQRMVYLQILAAIEFVWFGAQFVLWKMNFYGTIFYLLLLIPSILFGSASFYALYEYYILSLVHTFLAVIFACGEFHLVGPHDDDTTLDPSDWSVLGVLALLAKLFKFRMPQATH